MKKVVYDNSKSFLLTNQEFSKAIKAWNAKKNFYLIRLQALLSPYYKYVETPREELNFEIFLLFNPKTKGVSKVLKRGNSYYQKERGSLGSRLVPCKPSLEQRKRMVNQEDYYLDKKLLE